VYVLFDDFIVLCRYRFFVWISVVIIIGSVISDILGSMFFSIVTYNIIVAISAINGFLCLSLVINFVIGSIVSNVIMPSIAKSVPRFSRPNCCRINGLSKDVFGMVIPNSKSINMFILFD